MARTLEFKQFIAKYLYDNPDFSWSLRFKYKTESIGEPLPIPNWLVDDVAAIYTDDTLIIDPQPVIPYADGFELILQTSEDNSIIAYIGTLSTPIKLSPNKPVFIAPGQFRLGIS